MPKKKYPERPPNPEVYPDKPPAPEVYPDKPAPPDAAQEPSGWQKALGYALLPFYLSDKYAVAPIEKALYEKAVRGEKPSRATVKGVPVEQTRLPRPNEPTESERRLREFALSMKEDDKRLSFGEYAAGLIGHQENPELAAAVKVGLGDLGVDFLKDPAALALGYGMGKGVGAIGKTLTRKFGQAGIKEVGKAAQKEAAHQAALEAMSPHRPRPAGAILGEPTVSVAQPAKLAGKGSKVARRMEASIAVDGAGQTGFVQELRVDPTKALKNTWSKFYANMIDKSQPINEFMKAIGVFPKTVMDDPYLAARLARGEAINQVSYESDRFMKPVLDHVGKFDDSPNLIRFKAWGKAKRGITLQKMIDKNPKHEGRAALGSYERGREATGFTIDEMQGILSEYGHPEFERAFDALVTYNNYILRKLYKSGVIDGKHYSTLVKSSPDVFAPLTKVGKKGASKGKERFAGEFNLRRFMGGDGQTIDPVEGIIRKNLAYTLLAKQNEANLALLNMIRSKETLASPFVKIDKSPLRKVNVKADEVFKRFNSQLEAKGLKPLRDADVDEFLSAFRKANLADNQMLVWDKGKPVVLTFDEEVGMPLLKAMQSFNPEQSKSVMRLFEVPATVLKLGATGRNPEFPIFNIPRDVVTGLMQANKSLSYIYNLPKSFMDVVFKRGAYQEYVRSGAPLGGFIGSERYMNLAHVAKNLSNQQKGWLYMLRKERKEAARKLLDKYARFIQISEEVPRYAEWKSVWKANKNLPLKERRRLAALAAKEVTVDFSRWGWVGRDYNKMTAFFNPSVQGVDKMLRRFAKNPAKTIARGFAYQTIPTIFLTMHNADNPRFQRLSSTERALFWWVPLNPFNKKSRLLPIPKPREWSIPFVQWAEEMVLWNHEQNKMGRDYSPALNTLSAAMKQGAISVIPTIIPIVAAVGFGYDTWRMREVETASDKKRVPEERWDEYTTSGARIAGELTGTSPKRIDLSVRNIFPVGVYGSKAVGLAGRATNKAGLTDFELPPLVSSPKDVPFARRLAREDSGFDYNTYEKFRKARDMFGQVKKSANEITDRWIKAGKNKQQIEARLDELIDDYIPSKYRKGLSVQEKRKMVADKAKLFSEAQAILDDIGKATKELESARDTFPGWKEARKALNNYAALAIQRAVYGKPKQEFLWEMEELKQDYLKAKEELGLAQDKSDRPTP